MVNVTIPVVGLYTAKVGECVVGFSKSWLATVTTISPVVGS